MNVNGPFEIPDSSANKVPETIRPNDSTVFPEIKDKPRPLPKADSVTFSPHSQDLESLRDAISRLPEIRQEHLNRIRQILHSGTYQVSSEQIADRIIQETVRNSRHLP